jgi:hypothetical protein
MGDVSARVGSRWYWMNIVLGALFLVKKKNIDETFEKRK